MAKTRKKAAAKKGAVEKAPVEKVPNSLLFSRPLAEMSMEETRNAQAPGGQGSMLDDWIAKQHQGPYDSAYGSSSDPALKVPQGQLTFDAEGTEGGRYHSRTAHWPGGRSGVTIGRGYDLGQGKSKRTIKRELTGAGISAQDASRFAKASKKHGTPAKTHLRNNKKKLPEITKDQQKALFATTFESEASVVRRISEKSGVKKKYGAYDLERGDPAIRDLMVDLKYRGDYTGHSRKRVQSLAAKDDLAGLATDMSDRSLWKNVPPDRFERRKAYANEAAQEEQIERNLPFTFAAPIEQMGNPNLDFWGRPVKKKGQKKP